MIQLGRYGDVINILPVARLISQEDGNRVAMVTHKDYIDALEGVSYVMPLEWSGDQMQPHQAAGTFGHLFSRIIVSQVADNSRARERLCESYNMESWRYAGYLDRWSDPAMATVFDRRSADRERELVEAYRLSGKPFVLVNTLSFSSPFPYAQQLYDGIHSRWGRQILIVNMERMRAKKFHDLLGLLDRAVALVTVDTSTLHLAAASSVPVIALISDHTGNHWFGTKPRCRVIRSMRYREYPSRKAELHSGIAQAWEESRMGRESRVSIPVTLIGVDNFTPNLTAVAMTFSSRLVTFTRKVLCCRPGTTSPFASGLELVGCADLGTERLERERFMIMRLGKMFETSHCLHIEGDARIANPNAWDPSWLQYDYIGAPWAWPFDQPGFPPCTSENCVGNLGFSLVSKRFCDAVASIANPTDVEARLSDVYMCRTLRPKLTEMGIQFAPESVAAKFSCEGRFYVGQFGFHGKQTAELNGFRLT